MFAANVRQALGRHLWRPLAVLALAGSAALAAHGLTTARAETPPEAASDPLGTEHLADGPYSRMEAMLRRTIFRIDVVRVGVRVDPETQGRLESIAAGRSYSEERAGQVAAAIMEADHVLAAAELQRDIPLSRFLDEVREDVAHARKAGFITEATHRQVLRSLPEWFGALEDRGMRGGDLLVYRVRPDSLRTVLLSADGNVVIDQVDEGPEMRRVLLASYFAPGTSFREPLIRSLFD